MLIVTAWNDNVNLRTGAKCDIIKIPFIHTTKKRDSFLHRCLENTQKGGNGMEHYKERAKALLGWEAEKTLDDMCRDSWRWQKGNPRGYQD